MPNCPKCHTPMELRTARIGPNAGGKFWGCGKYFKTGCKGTRPVEREESFGPDHRKLPANGNESNSSKLGALEKQVERMQNSCKQFRDEQKRVENQIDKLVGEQTDLRSANARLQHECKQFQDKQKGLENQVCELSRERADLRSSKARLQQMVSKLKQELETSTIRKSVECPHRHLLGVSRGRTAQQGRAAMARLLHNNQNPEAQRLMKLANVAYDALSGR